MTIGHKTRFLRGDGAEVEIFVATAEVLEIGDITITRETVEDTTFDNDDGYETFVGALKNGGEFTLKVKYKKGSVNADAFVADVEIDDPVNYQIIWPDAGATQLDFSGLITSVGIATPQKENITQSFTFKVSGKPTWS